MARARNIKPGLFKNEVLGIADPLITLLFENLWCLADREGRLEDRPLRIKAETFPYRENIDVNGYLTELQRMKFICRYTVGGERYIQVLNFHKHQNPHKTEKASTIPEMPDESDGCALTVVVPLDNGPRPADSLVLIPDSLFTDSGYPQPEAPPESEKVDKPETARTITAADLSIAMRKTGLMTQPADPRLIALAVQGVTPETATAACEEAKQAKPNQRISLGYVFAILERWSADAAALKVAGASAPKSSGGAWWASDATILAKGLELNLKPLAGERMPDFKARIQAAIDNDGKPPAPAKTASIITPQKPIEPKGVKPEGMPSLKSFVKHAPGGSQ